MICELAGDLCAIGACPLCDGVADSSRESPEGRQHALTPRPDAPARVHTSESGGDASEPWQSSGPLEVGSGGSRTSGSSPPLPTTSRPPVVEANPHPPTPPTGAAHAAPGPTPSGVSGLSWSEYVHELASGDHPMASATRAMDAIAERSPLERVYELMQSMTPEEWAEYLLAESALDMTESLHAFLVGAFHELEPGTLLEDGPHIRAVCDHVQAQLEDRAIALGLMPRPPGWTKMRAQNLLVRIPPRCLKTIIVTVAASAWAWLRWPTMRILSLSSNPRVTSEAADKVRGLIRSDWYQQTFRPSWRIREDMDALSKFGNTAGGWRAARGMTSRITGEGADWLVIDDPHDGAEVYSKAKREAVTKKWRTSIANRVNDPRYAIRTGVMQALHFDDWGQHRIADGWGALVIRMRYELRDAQRLSPYGWRDWRTVEGESVLPLRFTPEWCDQEKKDKGAIDWAAQYQQDPAPIDGGIVQASDLRYYESLEGLTIDQVIISVDASFKKTTSGSRVSVLVVARGRDATGKQVRIVLDNDTRPMHGGDTIASIKAMRKKYPRAHTILIEDKANGSEIVRLLQLEFVGVVAVNPGNNSKESRLMACQSFFLANQVLFPKFATWLDDMKYEVCTFPNAPKDDQVDSLVQALLFMRSSTGAARSRHGCQL